MKRALREYWIHGIRTTIPFHMEILTNEQFLTGDYDTGIVDSISAELGPKEVDPSVAAVAAVVMAHRKKGKRMLSTRPRTEYKMWRMVGRLRALRKFR
jgi:acetyl/propionyl-CoA carboxylase alpha subunit